MFGQGRGGFGGQRGGFSSPVKVGEELDVKIEAVGEKGDGIAKKRGFVLFIPGVKVGDEVHIKVTKVLRKVGFAEVTGEAQGPIEQDSRPAPSHDSSGDDQGSAEDSDMDDQQPEPAEEDSEDFGEEPEDDEEKREE